MKKTIILLLLLTISVLNFAQNNDIPKDGTYYTYYLNNGEKIMVNEKDYKSETIKKGGEEILIDVLKTPKGIKKISKADFKYLVSKTYLGHKLIERVMNFEKKIDGFEDNYWYVVIKTKGFFLAYVPKSTYSETREGHAGSNILLSAERDYCVFDKDRNKIMVVNKPSDFKKCLETYFPELENFNKYFESTEYKFDACHWKIVDIAGDILAHKYYKNTPVLDNPYFMKSKKDLKKKIEEVQTFAPKDESNTTTE